MEQRLVSDTVLVALDSTEDYTKSFAEEGRRENRKGESKCDSGNRYGLEGGEFGEPVSIRFVGLRFLFIDIVDVIEVVVVQWRDGPAQGFGHGLDGGF